MKREWTTPELITLEVNQTMASGAWGEFDEGYNDNLDHDEQTGFHHVS